MAADARHRERRRSYEDGTKGQSKPSSAKANGDRAGDRSGDRAGDRAGDRVVEQAEKGDRWERKNGERDRGSWPPADNGLSLPAALRGVGEATEPTEWALRCASVVLEHPTGRREETEAILAKLSEWLATPATQEVLSQIAASAIPGSVARAIRKFRNEPPSAALACLVAVRSSGSAESTAAYIRAGAVEEVYAFMDRHPHHGGVQNVSLLCLGILLKDSSAARLAVGTGAVSRVLRAMGATVGREVQYNGLVVLRLLTDSGRTPRSGVQEVAMRAKVSHSSDTALCSVANDVLAVVTPRFKEVLCWHWQSGWCKLGPRCTYAHGASDLRRA
uniref:C3H1-type domain-containing protein n=1 Tax=Pyrodinium bahamense TaxID=73915 RepID=A0A7S0AG82_9DINO